MAAAGQGLRLIPHQGASMQCQEMQTQFHPQLEALFQTFNQEGLCWCLLRLPSEPAAPRGDVDLLIDPNDRGRMHRLLETLGYVRVPAGTSAEFVYLSYHPP